MPKTIIISGDIGLEVTPAAVRDQLQTTSGDIDVHVSSRGGSVYAGIEIYNQLRDYKKSSRARMNITLKSWAMSMGSYIATVEGADLVAVEDNAVFMLHNPMMFGDGDYRDYEKNAEYLRSLADLMSQSYSRKSGKPLNEIREMMDAETYLFGQEIVSNGFADTLIQSEEKKEKVAAIAQARINIQGLRAKFSNTEQAKQDLQQVAAMFKDQVSGIDRSDVYAQGIQQGINNFQARVKALHELKRQPAFSRLPGIDERIDQAIMSGESVEEVQISLLAMLTSSIPENYNTKITEV